MIVSIVSYWGLFYCCVDCLVENDSAGLYTRTIFRWSRDNSVGIVTDFSWRTEFWFLTEAIFSLLHRVQTGSGAHRLKLTNNHHPRADPSSQKSYRLCTGLSNLKHGQGLTKGCRAIDRYLTFPSAVVAWRLIKYRNNLTFLLYFTRTSDKF
jgi:hypothetical protein